MVTFLIDDNAEKILKYWADDFSDLVIRFGNDITPRFTKGRLVFKYGEIKPFQVQYSVNLDKIAYMYIPSANGPSMRFIVKSSPKPFDLCAVVGDFEKPVDFFIHITYIFSYLNAFILTECFSAKAKKAMQKKTLLDYKRDTFFTVRDDMHSPYLDTCNLSLQGDKYII